MSNATCGYLVDHREDLIAERTRIICRLRWQLHELNPGWTPPARIERRSAFDTVAAHLSAQPDNSLVRRQALRLVDHLRLLTVEIDELTEEITTRVGQTAPSLLAIVGCGALTAAKILGETAGANRFHSKDAYARHNGTAPLPVWSSNKQRHRLSRTGNRQLNAAIHRIAITQARFHPPARQLLDRRKKSGDGGMEALRILKRRLSDVVYRAMLADQKQSLPVASLLDRGARDTCSGLVRPPEAPTTGGPTTELIPTPCAERLQPVEAPRLPGRMTI